MRNSCFKNIKDEYEETAKLISYTIFVQETLFYYEFYRINI